MSRKKILILADETVPAYYQYYNDERFKDIDLIISCGDLPASYLSFIATASRKTVLYVPGNHDERYLHKPPLGCINIDDSIYVWNGLRILGLGGSIRYKDGPYQYTPREMRRRIKKLWFKLLKYKGIDILVTHAPAELEHVSLKDHTHEGFACFTELLDKYHPEFMFHGHIHLNYGQYPRISHYHDTTIINGFERYIVEVDIDDWHDR